MFGVYNAFYNCCNGKIQSSSSSSSPSLWNWQQCFYDLFLLYHSIVRSFEIYISFICWLIIFFWSVGLQVVLELICIELYAFSRSLGGKLGQQLEDQFKVEFMSQLVPITLSDLQRVVGAKNGYEICICFHMRGLLWISTIAWLFYLITKYM